MSEDPPTEPGLHIGDASDVQTNPAMYREADRERGMLTRTDRELLLNRKEYDSEQGLRNARYRVREHIRNSFNDLFLTANTIEQSELEKIIDRQQKLNEEGNHKPVSYTSALLLLACRLCYTNYAKKHRSELTLEEIIESDLETAIRSAVRRVHADGIVTDLEIDISIKTAEDRKTIFDDLISGQAHLTSVVDCIQKYGSQPVQNYLKEHDEVINLSDNTVVGPEHDIFDLFD